MPIFRLLVFSLVIATGVVSLSAQAPPAKIPANIAPGDSVWLNSSADTDLLSLELNPDFNPPTPTDRNHVENYRAQLERPGTPQTWLQPDSPADHVCLKMRVYKVARDGPNSDSMHPAGYTTCSPAARFTTHTIDGVIQPATP